MLLCIIMLEPQSPLVHLLMQFSENWNATFIHGIYLERCREILKIPLINLARMDEIIWQFNNKKNLYSV